MLEVFRIVGGAQGIACGYSFEPRRDGMIGKPVRVRAADDFGHEEEGGILEAVSFDIFNKRASSDLFLNNFSVIDSMGVT